MKLDTAPFYNDVALGSDEVQAYWARASDDVRIRLAVWRADAGLGTILMFPGRTEFVEKYAMSATAFAAQGYSTIAVDWRGQGLADRLIEDRRVGYVEQFQDYQKDVAAMVEAAQELDLPKPWYVFGHSMGGCIGLRALYEGIDVNGAIFSAPMWGILMSSALRPAAWALSWASKQVGLAKGFAPGTSDVTYVLDAPFEGNSLNTDPEMYRIMQDQVRSYPELSLAGPSLHWLHEALVEARDLAARPAPSVPGLTFLGSQECIVDSTAIKDRMQGWSNGELRMVEGAEHEVLMESKPMRDAAMAESLAFFNKHHDK
jgi:lysophospholipase